MKLLLILLALPMIGFGQNVNIPDPNFKGYLVGNTAINTNGDSEIQVSEASAFNGTINCYNMNIFTLTGIEAFTALTNLSCIANHLTVLNVSANTALTYLDCAANQLTSLDVRNGNNTNLFFFSAFFNPNLYCIDVDNPVWSSANWTVANGKIDPQSYFSNNCNPTYPLQVFLDGYYLLGSNPAAMRAARYNNLLASGSSNPGANTDVDVITVELRSPSNLDVVAYSVSPILQTNGSVQCVFPAGALGGSFYIVVKHRAAIPLWSANPILISNGTAINFSNNVLNSFSDGDSLYPSVHELNPGLFGIWLGELNDDGYLDGIDYTEYETDLYLSQYGGLYMQDGDLNGDAYVDASDYSVFHYNSQQGVYKQRPYAITTNNVSIGQSYQGGKIAYILQAGDPGYDANVQHGLIAAPSDQGYATWGCQGTGISGADGTAIGTGAQNTIDIMNGCSTAGIAARLCGDLVLGGYSDWYLPSLDELSKLYLNRAAIGGFANNDYWSSSESSDYGAWRQDQYGFQYGDVPKYSSNGSVRAFRAF